MRVVAAAVMISLAAHGAVIAWMCRRPRGPKVAVTASPRVPSAGPIQPASEPMIVDLVEVLPDPAHAAGVGTQRTHLSTSSTVRRVAIAATPGGPPGGALETAVSGLPGPEVTTIPADQVPSTGLSADFVARFLDKSKPVPPKDTDAERIADDLAHDREALANPKWVATASPEEVFAMRQKLVDDLDRQDHQELHPAGGGRFKSEHVVHDMSGLERESYGVDVAPDGTIRFHDASNVAARGLAGSFDLTEWAMRSHGDDPYAHDKLVWLDKTRDDRIAIGERHQREVLAHTPQYVQQNLTWAWQRVRDVATRKRDLFDLWDDCAESGDDAMVAAGSTARSYVIGFIRAKLPADSPDAYTAAELADLNAHRRSIQSFAPYAD
jgi:hypothetical protein